MKRTTFFISIILILLTIGLQTTLAQVVFEHGSQVISVVLSRDGTILASGAWDGTVKLWDVGTHTNIATFEEHTDSVWSVSLSPNGMLLASGSADGTVKLWEVDTHTNITTLEGHANTVTSVAFSPDGTTVASGALDGTVKLWDVDTHQNTATFGGHDASILEGDLGGWLTPVSFLDDTTLASGAGNSIKLWDVDTHQNIGTFGADLEGVVSVSFSPAGTTLASGLLNDIQLWDVATRTNSATFPPVSTEYLIPFTFLSFSPDGTLIASTLDASVTLWDVETSTKINTLLGHTNAVRSVSFSSDGSLLASGALDGTVRLWDASFLQPALVASTEFPLTEATLHGSVVTLTLNGWVYEQWLSSDAATVSGIDGVTVEEYIGVDRVSDTEVTVELTFDGTDLDTDATLTFTLDAWTIVDGNDREFTAQVPVTAIQNSNATVSVSPASVVSPDVGKKLTFNLNITGGENVAGYQATVSFAPTVLVPTFDPTTFQLVGITNGNYLPGSPFFADPVFDETYQEGLLGDEIWEVSVTIAASTLAGAANGDGTLATLTFEVVDFKPSTVTLSKVYLVDTDGQRWEATTESAEVTVPPEQEEAVLGDINRDGVVDILDLTIVGARYGQRGPNTADLNGDHLVDIVDLVLVANAFGEEAAAPSAHPRILELFTVADVKLWLSHVQQLDLTDPTALKGILFLEQLLATLLPKETVLLPNYPNPFNPETWIPYHLAKDADVALTIYDTSGQVVRQFGLGYQAAGRYQNRSRAIYWNGKNEFGEQVVSGVYFYHLSAGRSGLSVPHRSDYSATRKMLILK